MVFFLAHSIYRTTAKFALNLAILATFLGGSLALAQSPDSVDLDALTKIKAQGFQHSQVMNTMSYLTDVYGPRLTASPNFRAAGDWTIKALQSWGLSNCHLEPWLFGRSWENNEFTAQAVLPQVYPLIAYPAPWTPGTNGPVTARAIMVTIHNPQDFEKYRGKLKDLYVMVDPIRELTPHFDPQARRYTDEEMLTQAKEPDPTIQPLAHIGPSRAEVQWQTDLNRFFLDEGVAAILLSGKGEDGTVYVGNVGSYRLNGPPAPSMVYLAVEHYNRIARTLQKNIPVSLKFDIRNTFDQKDPNAFNIIAEIPGSDAKKKDEVVMIGGHFDSWTFGTGATDDGAGAGVMIEAIRILKATGLPMRRTVRLALWGGEEQGLLGSQEYVKQHFTDPETMKLKPEFSKLAAYFNVDSGTGLIRGVYLQHNEAVVPIFQEWMRPFHNMGMKTVANSVRGGTTDHLSFDDVGLPGFRFIQDPVEYGSRTHHSNMDVYDRLVPADMMENAVIVATFVYQAANRNEPLPRKAVPPPHESPYTQY